MNSSGSHSKRQPAGRPEESDWTVRRVVEILKRRRTIVILAISVGTLFAVAFMQFWPAKYQSKAQLLVMRKDSRFAARGVDAGAADSERITEDLLATHMQMLQGRVLVQSALEDDGLDELPSIVERLTEQQKACDYVIQNMLISRGGTGQARSAHVLNISMNSRSKADCQTILRAIIKRYQLFLASKFQDVNQEAATLIAKAQQELADDLEGAEKAYEEFRQESSSLMWKDGSETTNVHRVRYEGILQELAALQLTRAEAEARLDAVNERIDGGDGSNLSELEKLSLVDEKNLTRVGLLLMAQKGETESPNFQAEMPLRLSHARVENESYAEMQLKEKTLLTELGERHPDVINVRKQIASLEGFLQKQRGDLKSGRSNFALDPKALFEAFHQLLKNDILAMDRREERLKDLAEDAVRLASETVTDEIEGESLKREVQRKQALFDAAVDRLRDINIAKDYGGFINEVLAEPELGRKVMPKLSYAIVLGLFITTAIGLPGVAIAEYRDRRFHSIQELQNSLQLTVMGRIPLEVGNRNSTAKARNGSSVNHRALALDSNSIAADAFRLLRTSLIVTVGDSQKKVICLTSPSPGDGKSSIAANLAISLGQLGRRVLLIDCDLRRPSQQDLFSASNERGLTEVIDEEIDPTDAIQQTTYKNVWLMTRGPAVENPGEFLATGEFDQLLESLREKFDQILLDCPPVLAVPEVLTTAAVADGTILVIRADRTTQFQAQTTCTSLKQSGAETIGVVVNGLKPGHLGDESYGYGYGYGSEYSKYAAKDNASVETTSRQGDSGSRTSRRATSRRKYNSESDV